MYITFEYYQTEYGGKLVTDELEFNRTAKGAERYMDVITLRKLRFAFPTEDAEDVKYVECKLIDFITSVERAKEAIGDGYIHNKNGTVQGKAIVSISSGSESVSYSNAAATSDVSKAVSDTDAYNHIINEMIINGLRGLKDANGVNLLYAGPYPGKEDIWG